jgi:hypothetical protein
MLPAVSHHRLYHTLATRLALVRLLKDQDDRHAALPWSDTDWITIEAKLLQAEPVALNLRPDSLFETRRLAHYNTHKLRLYGTTRLKFPKAALAGTNASRWFALLSPLLPPFAPTHLFL